MSTHYLQQRIAANHAAFSFIYLLFSADIDHSYIIIKVKKTNNNRPV